MTIAKEQQEKLDKSLVVLAKGLYQNSIKYYPPVRYEGKNWHPHPGQEVRRERAESDQKTFKLAGFKTRIMPVDRPGREGWFMLLLRK